MKRNKLALFLMSFALIVLLAACGTADGQEAELAPVANEDNSAADDVEEIEEEGETAVSETESTEAKPESSTRIFTIVPEESEASYTVGEEFFSEAVSRLGVIVGLTETVGSTNEVEGDFELNLDEAFPLISSHFTVNIRSLTSDQSRRDERIQEQGLESNKFPIAEFVATAIENFPDDYSEGEEISFKLSGDLTIREITTPVTFDMTATLKSNTITGNASAIILMSDFGFAPPSVTNFFTVDDETLIQLVFTAKESG